MLMYRVEHEGKVYKVDVWQDNLPRDNPIGIYPTGEFGTFVVQVLDAETGRTRMFEYFGPHQDREAYDRALSIRNNPALIPPVSGTFG